MVTAYFRPEVEIWPFHACAVKNKQYLYVIGLIRRAGGRAGVGTVRSLWTFYVADATFHRTYFYSLKIIIFELSTDDQVIVVVSVCQATVLPSVDHLSCQQLAVGWRHTMAFCLSNPASSDALN